MPPHLSTTKSLYILNNDLSFTHTIDSVGLSMSHKIAKPLATTEGPEPFAKLAEDLDEIHGIN